MAASYNLPIEEMADDQIRKYGVQNAVHIYKGAFVSNAGGGDAGRAKPLAAGEAFLGIAWEEADNSAGADDAISVHVLTTGIFALTLSGGSIASIGVLIYASADDTITATAQGNSLIGRCVAYDSASGKILVKLIGLNATA